MSESLRIALVQFNSVVGDLPGNVRQIIEAAQELSRNADVIVFPELALSGYSPEDLVQTPAFKDAIIRARQAIIEASPQISATLVVPLPWPDGDFTVYNAAHVIMNGHVLAQINKHHLPNYRVFDEKRVFTAGAVHDPILTLKGFRLGLVICEDLWFPNVVADRKANGADLIISMNASPLEEDKLSKRLATASQRVKESGMPLLYLNTVGGQDEVVFDGASFVMDAKGDLTAMAQAFETDVLIVTCTRDPATGKVQIDQGPITSYPDPVETKYLGAMLGLRDYVDKNNFPGVLLGLSGGVDSALSLALAVDALGADRVRAVMMPSPFTSQDSLDDAAAMAGILGVSYQIFPIDDIMAAYERTIPDLIGLAHENMQSRARGALLMALSNSSGYMVLTTGNKSENAVGYATLYGDMCGGYNAIKDLYKADVYELSHWRNAQRSASGFGPDGQVIPERILTRAPSAELRPDQRDEDSLPPYPLLDRILRGLIDDNRSPSDLVAEGLDPATVGRVVGLLCQSEYKRRQAAPGAKLGNRAFGRDWRMPITNRFRG